MCSCRRRSKSSHNLKLCRRRSSSCGSGKRRLWWTVCTVTVTSEIGLCGHKCGLPMCSIKRPVISNRHRLQHRKSLMFMCNNSHITSTLEGIKRDLFTLLNEYQAGSSKQVLLRRKIHTYMLWYVLLVESINHQVMFRGKYAQEGMDAFITLQTSCAIAIKINI
jgi:hypothetical protein